MAGEPNGPFSVASPMMAGSVIGEIVNINRGDNSVQVRLHGYQDDTGNIPDEKLEWIKCLGQHAGIQGATATHPYYVGSKVMVSLSGTEKFIMGSVTGTDSDKNLKNSSPEQADASDDKDPNVPRQVRGSKGLSDISTGTGEDKTSKGKRDVTKTDKPFGPDDAAQKIFEYAKQVAPFDKGPQSMFPDLKTIGVDKLTKGSDVLNVIEQLDNDISGAIQQGTKIIKNLRQNGYGAASEVMGQTASAVASTQVSDFFGFIGFEELINALKRLLLAKAAVDNHQTEDELHVADLNATGLTPSTDFVDVPNSLLDNIFQVDPQIPIDITDAMIALDQSLNTVARKVQIDNITRRFYEGFNTAVQNSIAYVNGIVGGAGTPAILIVGTNSTERLMTLIGLLQRCSALVGNPPSTITSIGDGAVGQILQQGPQIAIPEIMTRAQPYLAQLSQMMQDMNTFRGEVNAMSELLSGISNSPLGGVTSQTQSLSSTLSGINSAVGQVQGAIGQVQGAIGQVQGAIGQLTGMMGGGAASIDETLTGITMKYMKKQPNYDGRGFTK